HDMPARIPHPSANHQPIHAPAENDVRAETRRSNSFSSSEPSTGRARDLSKSVNAAPPISAVIMTVPPRNHGSAETCALALPPQARATSTHARVRFMQFLKGKPRSTPESGRHGGTVLHREGCRAAVRPRDSGGVAALSLAPCADRRRCPAARGGLQRAEVDALAGVRGADTLAISGVCGAFARRCQITPATMTSAILASCDV